MFVSIETDNFPADHGKCPNCGHELIGITVRHWATRPTRCESGLGHHGEMCPACKWQTPGMCNTEAYVASVEHKSAQAVTTR